MRRAMATLGMVGLAAVTAVADYKEEDVANGGTIEGVIAFAGDAAAPEQKAIPADKQGDCGAMYTVEELVVNKDTKGIQYAVVYIDKIDHGKKIAKEQTVELDQKACVFLPHVVVAPVGSKVAFKNSDKAGHNVHVTSQKNESFNRLVPAGGAPIEWKAENPENVPVTCDIHTWMKSWVVVKAHPYVAVTDEKGSFKIEGVPPGDYTVKCWHEKLGIQQREGVKVKVEPGKSAKAEFKPLEPKK